ncbi:hypothetical protein SAMN05421788_106176 [Filimonas lacunae]|uniref:ABC-2 type transport system permease protein n=1 Tax=Filimonas lacunae TaxID=477680 RepID=A0A173MEX0_9BACT|nr:hypothetical protein [Filimonas lacunae]BAV06115.1 hypothetical protein FLA_2130 [Filimonas lacunae]SIT24714.1 hypothetical protein SAMN05421788_106176 [Filimonas lacunae]
MKTYFTLQWLRTIRGLKAFGLPPYLGVALIVCLFPVLSWMLFKSSPYVSYAYAAIPALLVYPLGNSTRNDFLQQLFNTRLYPRVRLTENLLVALPFVILLLIRQYYIPAAIALVLSAALSLYNKADKSGLVIPSPFSARPFEFTTGFRKSYGLILALYALSGIGLCVQNGNLSLFALAGIFLTCINFYSIPEPELYVWVYALTPRAFLLQKIKTAIWQSFLLTFIPALAISIISPLPWYIVPFIMLAGFAVISLTVAGKYSSYPQVPGLPVIICLVAGVVFPPAVLVLTPYLFKKSVQQLTPYLS